MIRFVVVVTKLKQAHSKKTVHPHRNCLDFDLNTIRAHLRKKKCSCEKTKAERRESPESRIFEGFWAANFSTCASLSSVNYQKRASTNVAEDEPIERARAR